MSNYESEFLEDSWDSRDELCVIPTKKVRKVAEILGITLNLQVLSALEKAEQPTVTPKEILQRIIFQNKQLVFAKPLTTKQFGKVKDYLKILESDLVVIPEENALIVAEILRLTFSSEAQKVLCIPQIWELKKGRFIFSQPLTEDQFKKVKDYVKTITLNIKGQPSEVVIIPWENLNKVAQLLHLTLNGQAAKAANRPQIIIKNGQFAFSQPLKKSAVKRVEAVIHPRKVQQGSGSVHLNGDQIIIPREHVLTVAKTIQCGLSKEVREALGKT